MSWRKKKWQNKLLVDLLFEDDRLAFSVLFFSLLALVCCLHMSEDLRTKLLSPSTKTISSQLLSIYPIL